MSLARQHREKHLAASPAVHPDREGGLAPAAAHTPRTWLDGRLPSLARSHRDRQLAAQIVDPVEALAATGTPAERAAAHMQLRLTHDLRRLKEIQSIEAKIAAKRDMLPAYRDWIDGLLAAPDGDREDEILPTIMVWSIDTGDFTAALDLADHVLAHDLPLPGRYERTAATLITEEIAEAALKAQAKSDTFPIDILARVAALTGAHDMHDQVRAKLAKAIGVEHMRVAEARSPETPEYAQAATLALTALRRAQELNDRAGVKDRIRKLEKALAPPAT